MHVQRPWNFRIAQHSSKTLAIIRYCPSNFEAPFLVKFKKFIFFAFSPFFCVRFLDQYGAEGKAAPPPPGTHKTCCRTWPRGTLRGSTPSCCATRSQGRGPRSGVAPLWPCPLFCIPLLVVSFFMPFALRVFMSCASTDFLFSLIVLF